MKPMAKIEPIFRLSEFIQTIAAKRGSEPKLMQAVIERIKEKGFTEVTIGAYHHEPEIQELYKKWGFTEFVKEAIEETTEGKSKFLLFLKQL